MICRLCSVISQEKWWVGDQSKKALSLPLNLSHSKDKGFSLCFCRISKALTLFYDKLSLQFNLGLQSLGAEKQAGRKWEEGTVARQARRQSMRSKQRVQETSRLVGSAARERQEGRQVPWNSSSQASNEAGRQAGKQARKLAGNGINCRKDRTIAHSKEAFIYACSHRRLISAKSGEPEKCGSVSRSGVCWAVDWIMYCWWGRSPVGGGTWVYSVSSVGNSASTASAGPRCLTEEL